jgi:hypothetical protein
VAGIHSQLKQLTVERGSLALEVLHGDARATDRVAEIDAQRLQLMARKETLEAGIRALAASGRTTDWRRHLPGMRSLFHATLDDQRDKAARLLTELMRGRQPHDLKELKAALQEIEGLRDTARWVADQLLPRPVVSYRSGDQAEMNHAVEERKRLETERTANIGQAVTELLASIVDLKKPEQLEDALAAARKRIQVGG